VRIGFSEVNARVHVLSSLVRAVIVFCGLEKQNSVALDIISVWGFTTIDICDFRGVTALAGSYNPWERARFLPIILHNSLLFTNEKGEGNVVKTVVFNAVECLTINSGGF
jgi:hypothetical protein